MGYLPKELILKAYKTLSMLTEDHKQGQTQITSYLRHLLAFDMYYKEKGDDCDLDDEENRNAFTKNVKRIVNIVDGYYTTNFYTNIKELDDCGVGSNFYSAGVVNNSKQNKSYTYDYPTRGQYPLFKVRSNKLIREESYFKNVNAYLKTQEIKCAFVIWVLRDRYIDELSSLPVKSRLLRLFTEELVEVIMPKEEKFNGYVEGYELANTISNISVNDLSALFGKSNMSHTTIQLEYSKYDIYRNAIQTKPFLLLAGISGTGKSRIVRELAFMTCPKELQDEDGTTPGNYCMIEVKPNWHDSSELLGYYSSFNGGGYRFTKFDRFVVKAWLNPDVPFFVCLDEMNLAPVEQYFAEFLSVLETRSRDQDGHVVTGALVDKQYFKDDTKMKEDLGLDGADDWTIKVRSDLVNKGLTLPPNLIVIGTVNMDDTTYQFSRKVIDRAMTIEMNGGELSQMFGNSNSLKYRSDEDVVKLGLFKAPYINADEVIERYQSQAQIIKEKLPEKLEAVNTALNDTPFQVSYRVLNELVIYLGALMDEATAKGEAIDDDALPTLINQAMDQITLMKILPRIEGDEDMFRRSGGINVLKTLQSLFSEDSDSYRKLEEMIDRLNRTGFTRFWP